jgi:hypothetical protein
MKRKRKYWYFITTEECPVCGRYSQHRERRYTRRPKDACKRHAWVPIYDWCDAF